MITVQETKTINIDDKSYVVDMMDDSIKQLVQFMDVYRQKEIDLTVELTMVRSAIRDVQTTIYNAITVREQEKAKQENAETAAE